MQRISALRYFKGKYFRSIDYILFKSDAENLKFDVEWLTVIYVSTYIAINYYFRVSNVSIARLFIILYIPVDKRFSIIF